MTKKEYEEGMHILINAGLKYEQEITKTQLSVWYELLKNMNNEDFQQVILYWIANETDFPAIADLLRTQKEMIIKIDVRHEIEKSNWGRDDCDPVVREAVRKCGGFYRLGAMTDKEYAFALKEIEEQYTLLIKHERFNQIKDQKLIKDA